MKKCFINPFLIFTASMLLAFLLYTFQWSELYRYRSDTLEIFIVSILIVSLLMAFAYHYWFASSDVSIQELLIPRCQFILILSILWGVFVCEVIDFGGIPFFMTLLGEDFNYQDFGVSKIHALFVPYYCAFSLVCFYRFMITKDKLYLLAVVSSILFSVFAMSRGTLIINCIGFSFIYLYMTRKIVVASASTLLLALVFIVMFGFMGDKRMVSSGYQSQDAIYEVGQADRAIFNEYVPSGFFWVYLYTSSSFANLQNQVKLNNIHTASLYELVRTSILPDYLSKRMPESSDEYSVKLITPELIVSTVFGLPIVIMGYLGIVIVFAWYCLLCWAALLLVNRTYFVPMAAILCSMSGLMLFDNMLVFGSFFTQIVLMLLMPMFSRSKYRFI